MKNDRMMLSNLLRGDKVRLTAFNPEDLPIVTRWYQNVLFMRLLDARVAAPQTQAQLQAAIEEQQKSNTTYLFAIRLLTDDALMGVIVLDSIDWTNGASWLGIAIGDEAHQNQGYGTEAVRLMLDFAFRELNLHRVQLTVFAYNPRAIALYEKIGFQREGVYREYLHRDGQRYDMYLYGILRREWKN
jgi:RimJ/RimL family protein N-acetyltransferase